MQEHFPVFVYRGTLGIGLDRQTAEDLDWPEAPQFLPCTIRVGLAYTGADVTVATISAGVAEGEKQITGASPENPHYIILTDLNIEAGDSVESLFTKVSQANIYVAGGETRFRRSNTVVGPQLHAAGIGLDPESTEQVALLQRLCSGPDGVFPDLNEESAKAVIAALAKAVEVKKTTKKRFVQVPEGMVVHLYDEGSAPRWTVHGGDYLALEEGRGIYPQTRGDAEGWEGHPGLYQPVDPAHSFDNVPDMLFVDEAAQAKWEAAQAEFTRRQDNVRHRGA